MARCRINGIPWTWTIHIIAHFKEACTSGKYICINPLKEDIFLSSHSFWYLVDDIWFGITVLSLLFMLISDLATRQLITSTYLRKRFVNKNNSTTVAGCVYSLMMTSTNGNIFSVTGPLCGEFTGHRGIPLSKTSDAELWCFLWSEPEQTVE